MPRRLRAVRRLLGACALLFACGELGPEYGDAVDGAATGGTGAPAACALTDSDPATPVTWAEVKDTILAKRCGCHMTPTGFGATVGGLLLADRASALLGGRHQKGGGDDAPKAIDPGQPCTSYLIAKTGWGPPFGARMPLSAKPLDTDERQLLIDWIAEGANP